MNSKCLAQQRNGDGHGGAVHLLLSPAQIFFPVTFLSRMMGMQNKYEMFRAAVYAVTNLSSVKPKILPKFFYRGSHRFLFFAAWHIANQKRG